MVEETLPDKLTDGIGSEFGALIGMKPSNQYAFDRAMKEGLRIVLPKGNELQLDFDDDESFNLFESLFHIARPHLGKSFEIVTNPSRHGLPRRHTTITLDHNVTMLERIALQACLGSDRKRELLSFIELQNGDSAPTLFFEQPAPEPGQDDDIPF